MTAELVESSLLRWIVAAPLLSAVLQGLAIAPLRRPLSQRVTSGVSCGAVLASFALSCAAFWQLVGIEGPERLLYDPVATWFGAGVGPRTFAVDIAFQFDALSAVLCFVVSGVGLLIHVYSIGYMARDEREDRGFQRFFVYLNLFVAAMLCLVLADNLLLLFLGWEGVGLCSYLLIGFWYADASNARAANQAFIVNRIGDAGFLAGILLLFWTLAEAGVGALDFRSIEAGFPQIAAQSIGLPAWLGGFEIGLPTAIGLAFLFGACGKSAQLPLHVWLPDAMAGPTPVSALIHAATMVTAGVYLICRLSFLYAAAPGATITMAWVGGLTAVFAALVAIGQNDVKKLLAWSTISQLGLMFLALGCQAWTAAMFHLVTHAFFKAALFLVAGVVLLASHHESDLRRLGGLREGLWGTYWVAVVAALALGGLPFLSGFFSKDEILVAIANADEIPGHTVLYTFAVATTALTAFYITRWLLLAFHGRSKLPARARNELSDPGFSMMMPLVVLAVLSGAGGLATLPQFWGDMIDIARSDSLENFLLPVLASPPAHEIERIAEWRAIATALVAAVAGWAVAWRLEGRRPDLAARFLRQVPTLHRWIAARFYVDAAYAALFSRPLSGAARLLADRIDDGLIDRALVGGTTRAVRELADSGLKYVQTGLAQTYLVVMLAGVLGIVGYLLR